MDQFQSQILSDLTNNMPNYHGNNNNNNNNRKNQNHSGPYMTQKMYNYSSQLNHLNNKKKFMQEQREYQQQLYSKTKPSNMGPSMINQKKQHQNQNKAPLQLLDMMREQENLEITKIKTMNPEIEGIDELYQKTREIIEKESDLKDLLFVDTSKINFEGPLEYLKQFRFHFLYKNKKKMGNVNNNQNDNNHKIIEEQQEEELEQEKQEQEKNYDENQQNSEIKYQNQNENQEQEQDQQDEDQSSQILKNLHKIQFDDFGLVTENYKHVTQNLDKYTEFLYNEIQRRFTMYIKPYKTVEFSVEKALDNIFSYRESSQQIPHFARQGDWVCLGPDCRNLNFTYRDTCNTCNLNRNDIILEKLDVSEEDKITKEVEIYKHNEIVTNKNGISSVWICSACQCFNYNSFKNCKQCNIQRFFNLNRLEKLEKMCKIDFQQIYEENKKEADEMLDNKQLLGLFGDQDQDGQIDDFQKQTYQEQELKKTQMEFEKQQIQIKIEEEQLLKQQKKENEFIIARIQALEKKEELIEKEIIEQQRQMLQKQKISKTRANKNKNNYSQYLSAYEMDEEEMMLKKRKLDIKHKQNKEMCKIRQMYHTSNNDINDEYMKSEDSANYTYNKPVDNNNEKDDKIQIKLQENKSAINDFLLQDNQKYINIKNNYQAQKQNQSVQETEIKQEANQSDNLQQQANQYNNDQNENQNQNQDKNQQNNSVEKIEENTNRDEIETQNQTSKQNQCQKNQSDILQYQQQQQFISDTNDQIQNKEQKLNANHNLQNQDLNKQENQENQYVQQQTELQNFQNNQTIIKADINQNQTNEQQVEIQQNEKNFQDQKQFEQTNIQPQQPQYQKEQLFQQENLDSRNNNSDQTNNFICNQQQMDDQYLQNQLQTQQSQQYQNIQNQEKIDENEDEEQLLD
ncbi:hypothetical protein PPERSA_04315 [Pseudocohnilembus persalinus]|uniref:RanBP2-type domain-containing protein n=1 Tax=Pseudocohnilembus persalinus TaxID=266149 RepID=A0A0V0QQH3_PSEPJ|nr:hypothetical protein PPERSA_04315 [Pseudocohnilembus persalinus]|eukprot:KRX04500.1 hypothetical protein PPERSA_04315 [Pseudocohnilembus persalinus]